MKASTLVLVSVILLLSGCFKGTTSAEKQVTDFSDLYKNGTRIAVCDPGHCPAGRYAYMVISSIEAKDPELGEKIRANIVTNDPHVRAVLDKVVTREVDAGFVYITDAYHESDRVQIIEIPQEFSPLPQYGIAIMEDSKKQEEARVFVEFLMSQEGQRILQEYGFVPVVENPLPFYGKKGFSEEMLTVYAASSLTEAFQEVGRRFENATGVKVILGFGSSGTLRQRIEGGAPADVYATASLKHADLLINEGFTEEYKVFSRNRLIVVTSR